MTEHEMPVLSGANGAYDPTIPGHVPDPGKCIIPGTYETRAFAAHNEPAGCSNAHAEKRGEGDIVTVTMQGAHATVAFNSLRGACDGATIDGCRLLSKCDVEGPGGTATMQLEWQFDRTGFEGSVDALATPRYGDKTCKLSQRERGARRD